MEKMLNNFVALGCDKALTECEEYIQKEYGGEYSLEELFPVAMDVVYRRAVKDTIETLMYFKIL